MRVYFGTVVRGAAVERAGELVSLDWNTKRVLGRVPIYPTDPDVDDPNPRGNTRGCKGILVRDDTVIAANYHTLLVHDLDLRLQRRISHGLMVGLHELCFGPAGEIWACATSIDAALAYDDSGKLVGQYWPREIPGLQQQLGLTPEPIDKDADNRLKFLDALKMRGPSHLHLNAVAAHNGELFALFNRFGVVANLSRGTVAINDPAIKRGHNLVIRDDGTAIVNDTWGRTIRFYDVHTGQLQRVIDLMAFSEVRRLEALGHVTNRARQALAFISGRSFRHSREIFVRGLSVTDSLVFVGISPASILAIDYRDGRLVDMYRFSRNVFACIHGLAAVP